MLNVPRVSGSGFHVWNCAPVEFDIVAYSLVEVGHQPSSRGAVWLGREAAAPCRELLPIVSGWRCRLAGLRRLACQ